MPVGRLDTFPLLDAFGLLERNDSDGFSSASPRGDILVARLDAFPDLDGSFPRFRFFGFLDPLCIGFVKSRCWANTGVDDIGVSRILAGTSALFGASGMEGRISPLSNCTSRLAMAQGHLPPL